MRITLPKAFIILGIVAILLATPSTIHAQWFESLSASDCMIEGVPTFQCLPVLLRNIVRVVLIGSALATLFFLIWGGIKYTLSGGDPKKVSAARSTIMYAIIGVAMVFLSFVIIRVVSTIAGNTDIDPTQSEFQFEKPQVPGAQTQPNAPGGGRTGSGN